MKDKLFIALLLVIILFQGIQTYKLSTLEQTPVKVDPTSLPSYFQVKVADMDPIKVSLAANKDEILVVDTLIAGYSLKDKEVHNYVATLCEVNGMIYYLKRMPKNSTHTPKAVKEKAEEAPKK